MEELRFGDIKKMDYNDNLPFKYVLVDLLYKRAIDVNFVLSCYTGAINLLDKGRINTTHEDIDKHK